MNDKNTWACPVCGFDALDEPPHDAHGCASFDICPCCGTEFGYDGATVKHSELRARWVGGGTVWWSAAEPPPTGWDPKEQLRRAALPDS